MAGGFAVSNRVVARNGIGRFIRECEMAAERTVKKAVDEGADMSRALAPVGPKEDPRTIPLKASIYTRMLGRTAGEWGAAARHAMAQEFGAGPHIITGNPNLAFYWEAAGRRFVPASVYYRQPGLVTVVNHPGNPAHPYLRPAYEAIRGRVMAIAAEEYPG
jgi:hypothetical protein